MVLSLPASRLGAIPQRPQEEAALTSAQFLPFFFFPLLRGGERPPVRDAHRFLSSPCNQLLQYGSGLPEQIGRPTKRRTTVAPPPRVLSAGALYQVLNAAAEALNEIIAGRGRRGGGGAHRQQGEWLCLGGGGVRSETSQGFQNNLCFGGRAPCFFPALLLLH